MPSASGDHKNPSEKNPLTRLAADRSEAREQNDGWAALCTLGTVNAEGDAEQRTLVLRELDDQLALFFSALSPKWQEIQARPTCSVQLYMPSVQVQYRLRVRWSLIDPELVRSSWMMRPDIPKKLDWLYQQHPQSSTIARDELLEMLAPERPLPQSAPDTAMGVYLTPERVERLQLSSGVHQREQWLLVDHDWQHAHLVP